MKELAIILIAVSAAVLVGCGKMATPASTAAEQVEPAVPAPTAARPAPVADSPMPVKSGKPAQSIQDQLQGTIHPEMTMRLRLFEQTRGRLPENFYELQNMGAFDSTPGLPPNMMYVIDRKDKTVKIVKK